MSEPYTSAELAPLIERVVDGAASEAERARLAAILMDSQEARKYYARYLHVRSLLMQGAHVGVPLESQSGAYRDLTETMVLPAIPHEADIEGPAPSGPSADFPVLPPPGPSWQRKQIWRFSIAAMLVVALLVLGAILGRPGKPAPAVLVADADAQWPAGKVLHPGDPIHEGPLQILSGEARLQLRTGVSILLEGPATVQVRSDNAADLTIGKLTATVPPEATGFTVHAGAAQIVDRGTEFGVEVKADNTVALHVLRGKVKAQPNDAATPTLLVAGQIATLTTTTVTIQPPEIHRDSAPVIASDNALDVCDLLCGGDGTTHQRDHAVEVSTGEAGLLPAVDYTSGDHGYHPVPSLVVVDGCFIPDGTDASQQVDSAGHKFRFDATMNRSFNRLWIGGKVPTPGPIFHVMPTALGGVDYSALPHGFLAMHTNKGITLNLDAVRKLQPGRRLAEFRCIAGNSTSMAQIRVNLTVLVDGEPAFPVRTIVSRDTPVEITVPISAATHFLTIASTQGDKKMGDNFLLLGDPMFDFKGQ